MNNHVKSMASAVVIIVDVIAGIAAPAVFRHHAHANMTAAYGLYVVLAVASLCVARYLTTPVKSARQAKPAQRSYIPGSSR